MKRIMFFLTIMLVMAITLNGSAQDAKKTFKYVGAAKCKMCHKGEKNGNIFEIWEKSTHAKAFETLASDHAKEVAKKAGVTGDPQQAKECLSCHVTGYNAAAALKEASLTNAEGVSCEACHGPGSEYKSMKVMKDLTAGTVKPADVGLIKPNAALCVKCHNTKSPTYKEFKFEEAVKAIAHPLPKKG
ncbi:MAG: cytochrome c family protein [candidate division KSB1 bacterium]|nr:cytochrome c family protein [candidate division KSB1 bacterium]